MISVALIEDNHLVREGLTALLDRTNQCKVVAAWATGDIPVLNAESPHVILLDIGLESRDSLRVAEEIRLRFPQAKVIVMDLIPSYEDIVALVDAGISGFLMKDATLEDLLDTIQSVVAGAHILPPEMTSTLFSQIARDSHVRGRGVRMTAREQQVIELIGDGLSNKEIARQLKIATHTVKSHVRNIMEKLALHTRLQIAAYHHKDQS